MPKKKKKQPQILPYALSWSEAKYFDLWDIVHFIAGVVFGMTMVYLYVCLECTIVIGLCLAILWEFFEKWQNIHESLWNRFLDVVVAFFGGIFGYWLGLHVPDNTFQVLAVLIGGFFVLIVLIGWHYYFKAKRKKREKRR